MDIFVTLVAWQHRRAACIPSHCRITVSSQSASALRCTDTARILR